MLSERARTLKTSPTLFLVAKAKELVAKGHDVISLTVGEPDWSTFPEIKDAGIVAIQTNNTKYTPAQGTVELRNVISKKLKQDFNQDWSNQEITVASGAKFVIFAALQMICNPGDEVIISSPYWVSYPTMIELADGIPRIVVTNEKESFKIQPEQLEKNINSKTKGFLFCSPSNPTGLIYTREELIQLAEVLRKHPHVVIISDDMYNRLMFDGSYRAPHILDVAPDLKDRTIVINGGSKAYAMTGWRIGWGAGPKNLIKAMSDYQSQATGSPSSISQAAVLAGIEKCDPQILEINKLLLNRRKNAMKALSEVEGIKAYEPDGAFYLWVKISDHFGKTHKSQLIQGSKDFCDILLDEYFVATVPGIESGTEGYLRLSFATTDELFQKAIDRLKVMISNIK